MVETTEMFTNCRVRANASVTYTIQWILALVMVLLWPVCVITALAHDIQEKGVTA